MMSHQSKDVQRPSIPNFPKAEDLKTDKRVQFLEETGKYIFTDPGDGIEYEYDEDKGAWFPMWNGALIEQQQSAYGSADVNPVSSEDKHTKRKAEDKSTQRYRKRTNTSVYVSGLPLDTTIAEVTEYFSQCGTIMPDLITNEPKVKLYSDSNGLLKGDGLVTYYKEPSVQLALDILDDSQFRPSVQNRISVQRAIFKEKEGGSNEKKKARVNPKLAQKRLERLERKLDWYEGSGEVLERHKRTVILKHMFTPQEIKEDVTLLLDLPEDVREECEKLGSVSSIKVYDLSEEGVISVKFKDEQAAKICVKKKYWCKIVQCPNIMFLNTMQQLKNEMAMNGRFFAGQQIEASIYDGHTRYKASGKSKVSSADAENNNQMPTNTNQGLDNDSNNDDNEDDDVQRMEKFAQWLEESED